MREIDRGRRKLLESRAAGLLPSIEPKEPGPCSHMNKRAVRQVPTTHFKDSP